MAKIAGLSKGKTNMLKVIELAKQQIASNINCHNVGRIIAFDKDTQLCTVELLQIKQYNQQSYIPAPITDVPLIIYGSDEGLITPPNPVGCKCLLIFNDRNMDNFLETGEAYTPETGRMHDFTDCFALCSFKTLVNPVKDYDDNALSLIRTGKIQDIDNVSSVKLYPNLIELITSGKVRIANSKQNLAALMQSFLTACENIVCDPETGVITAASKQRFTDLKPLFNELLTAVGYTEATAGGGSTPSGLEYIANKVEELESKVTGLQTDTAGLNYNNISEWLSINYAAGYNIGDSFTAPSAGMVCCWDIFSNWSTTIRVNGSAVAYLGDSATGSTVNAITFLVAKGDNVTGMSGTKVFYPLKGQQ